MHEQNQLDAFADTLERLIIPFEIADFKKGDDDDTGSFEGLAAAFNNKDMTGDIIKPGAFKGSIKSPKRVKMLWQHQSDQPVGVWLVLEETDKGLHAEGKLVLGVQRADEALLLMKAGAVDGLSIGFRIPKGGAEFDEDTFVRTITKLELWEVSLVTFPANPKARITRVKSAAARIKNIRDYEAFLRDEGGFTANQATALAVTGWKSAAELRDGAGADDDSTELRDGADGFDKLSDALSKRSGVWSQ